MDFGSGWYGSGWLLADLFRNLFGSDYFSIGWKVGV